MTGMFDFEAHVRKRDPDASRQAARAISGKRVSELEQAVLNVLVREGPLTAWQIARKGGIEYGSTSPRLKQLEKKGLIVRCEPRVVEGRKASIVWQA